MILDKCAKHEQWPKLQVAGSIPRRSAITKITFFNHFCFTADMNIVDSRYLEVQGTL